MERPVLLESFVTCYRGSTLADDPTFYNDGINPRFRFNAPGIFTRTPHEITTATACVVNARLIPKPFLFADSDDVADWYAESEFTGAASSQIVRKTNTFFQWKSVDLITNISRNRINSVGPMGHVRSFKEYNSIYGATVPTVDQMGVPYTEEIKDEKLLYTFTVDQRFDFVEFWLASPAYVSLNPDNATLPPQGTAVGTYFDGVEKTSIENITENYDILEIDLMWRVYGFPATN